MVQPWTMTSTDGSLPRFQVGIPHPRSYGSFTRKIRRYVIDEGVVDLPTAIRSMTTLPAEVLRVEGRGTIQVGAFADLAIFDLDRVRDLATYEEPHQLSEGMVHVLVNGEFAIRDVLADRSDGREGDRSSVSDRDCAHAGSLPHPLHDQPHHSCEPAGGRSLVGRAPA